MKSKLLFTLLLWGFYVILSESFSLLNVSAGLIFSILCVIFTQKFLPLEPVENDVKLLRIFYWPIWVIYQIYVAGFGVIKAIVKGGKVSIVEVETKLNAQTLRIMLSRSVTLTPGTIFLSLQGNKIIVLWLQQKDEPEITDKEELSRTLLSSLEDILMKAEV